MSTKGTTGVRRSTSPAPSPLKVMVASSVYGFEDQIRQICATLTGYGYLVLNSFMGTIPNNPALSNQQNCVAAVDDCDVFFGIIRSAYGTGVVEERSITHDEVRRAVALRKPRWFVVDPFVPKARVLLRQYRFLGDGTKNKKFTFARTSVLDDVRVIDMYEDAIQDGTPVAQRRGHWVQECGEVLLILRYIEAQFKDVQRVRIICEGMSGGLTSAGKTKGNTPSVEIKEKRVARVKATKKVKHG